MLSSSGSPVEAALTPRAIRWAACLIVAAVFAAYAGSFSGPFVFDDQGTIVDNPSLVSLAAALRPPANGTPVTGRPVANLTFALNHALSGNRVGSYHAINLLIHTLAALTLFGVLRRTLAVLGFQDWGTNSAVMAGAAIALIWAVHPLATEAVTYVSQRVESLMGLFYLLALYTFIRWVESSGPPARKWAVFSVVSCLLGMGTKEVMVTAPLMIFLYDRTFVGRNAAEAWRLRRGYYLFLAATWALLVLLMMSTGNRGGTAGFDAGVPWWAYALTQFRALGLYLRLAIWPHPLVADYGRILGGPAVELGLDFAVIAALAIVSTCLLWRRSAWGYLGAWFFVVLMPSSSVVPVATEIIAERRMYLPLAACIAAFGTGLWLGLRALARKRIGKAAAVACAGALLYGAVALGLVAATAARNSKYQSLQAFWSEVTRQVPGNAGAWNNLGNAVAELGDLAGADANYREALRLVPDYADAHLNLANLLLRRGRPGEALPHYQVALRFRPGDVAVQRALGMAAYRVANAEAEAGIPVAAAEHYRIATAMRPDLADAHVNFGNVLVGLGRSAEAMGEFQTALRLEPAAADVHNNLGGLLAQSGRLTEARAQFEEALRLQPSYREARENLDRSIRLAAPGVRP